MAGLKPLGALGGVVRIPYAAHPLHHLEITSQLLASKFDPEESTLEQWCKKARRELRPVASVGG